MTVYSCGIDIEQIDRFDKYSVGDPVFTKLVEDIFTEKEIEINSKLINQSAFGIGFSCKEAVFKAFGKGWLNSNIRWKDIELLFDPTDIKNYNIILGGFAEKYFMKIGGVEIISEFYFQQDHIIFKVILTT